MSDRYWFNDFPNRTLCGVLEDMRQCYKTYNFMAIAALIEEAQYLANKMEASLGDLSDINEWKKMRSELKKEIRALKEEYKTLEKSKPKKETKDDDF